MEDDDDDREGKEGGAIVAALNAFIVA